MSTSIKIFQTLRMFLKPNNIIFNGHKDKDLYVTSAQTR